MKALVVYGTRYGTAAEIAEEIAKVLEDEHLDVDLVNAKGLKNCDVSSYDLLVVGVGSKWENGPMNL